MHGRRRSYTQGNGERVLVSLYLPNEQGSKDNREEGLHSFDGVGERYRHFPETYVRQEVAHSVRHSER